MKNLDAATLESLAQDWRAQRRGPVAFISTLWRDPWGGSEDLWAAAALHLAKAGFPVWISVVSWTPSADKIRALLAAGAQAHFRPRAYPVAQRMIHRLGNDASNELQWRDVERNLARAAPALVVLNDHYAHPPLQLLNMCAERAWPFYSICQSNTEHVWWPADDVRPQLSAKLSKARACFFVSHGNLRLAAKQLDLSQARLEVIRNTYGIPYGDPLAWPSDSSGLQLAVVGRLDPSCKGQDIVLEALAREEWRDRHWTLNFYGAGPNREAIRKLAENLGLQDRVRLEGSRNVLDIWRQNHVLALPSRAEGLPIAIVEAMMAGRPVVTTDVAGNAELLTESVDGFIAEAPTPDLFAKALERMWAARDRLAAMGMAGNQAVRAAVPPDPGLELATRLVAPMGGAATNNANASGNRGRI